jgi:hypothetical protein
MRGIDRLQSAARPLARTGPERLSEPHAPCSPRLVFVTAAGGHPQPAARTKNNFVSSAANTDPDAPIKQQFRARSMSISKLLYYIHKSKYLLGVRKSGLIYSFALQHSGGRTNRPACRIHYYE